MFNAVDRLLSALTTERPAVLVLDDLQWADRSTLRLLTHLVGTPGRPLLVIGTYRDTELGPGHPLPDAVAELLERHGVPGDRLECEISEHTVMADPRRAMAILERLRALGVRLSLDDFGTGHSSLSYLKRLPLDEVKIDRSFVMGMIDDDNDAAIVRTTIDLARNLGLEVVAEGVESQQILNDLSALSCDVAQGFFLSRPLPAAELDGWLAERSATKSV
jgi:EAL domain-containing protein (putative c-di-GMP-specific phosphodiesterase class I)